MSAVRTAGFLFAAAVLIGAGQPALAECAGRGSGTVCVYEDGSVWTPGGGYGGGYYDGGGYGYGNSRISKYPNAASPGPESKPAPSGPTGVLTSSGQSGNAWIMKPQGSGGATVLGGKGGATTAP